jgi:hypothetical protein
MGFTSTDDFVNEVTNNGKFWRADWNKITGTASAYAAGRWYDLSLLNGTPIANTYSGSALAAVAPSDSSGFGIYHGGNVSTDTKHLVNIGAYSGVATAVPGVLMLVDMCLYYPGIVTTSASVQNLTNSTSLSRYTDGAGLRAFFVMTTAAGANTPTVQISYTNQAGTASRTLPVTTALTASAIVGHISHSGTAANNYGPFLPLASGDTGIRSVQSLTITTPSATSGTGALVLCRPLATLPITTVSVAAERDLMNQLPSLPQIKDGACLTWLYFAGAATATSTNIYGYLDAAWG